MTSGSTGFGDVFPGEDRSNIVVDSVPFTPPDPRPSGCEGTWFYVIDAGSTLAFDLNVSAGIE